MSEASVYSVVKKYLVVKNHNAISVELKPDTKTAELRSPSQAGLHLHQYQSSR
ncbi:hypothetical protein PTD2_22342 [Pseudoalteromonas tunicata D2]|uniref:Uncharacterized protein n=1 Tax=Pseudoalteromonas tunicata D2 TaxID=87626 RepID=A4CB44_9GAMM|nr:hypothetical protein PTD2_22342 [Pseudoalteromonas tunicata D2]